MNKLPNEDPAPRERYPRTLWMYFREGMVAAHRRRPVSFYLLLAMPLALLFAAGLLDRSNLRQFAMVLCLLFLFFGVIMIRAVSDLFDITRSHFRAHQASFRDTLGEVSFASSLGEQVKKAQDD